MSEENLLLRENKDILSQPKEVSEDKEKIRRTASVLRTLLGKDKTTEIGKTIHPDSVRRQVGDRVKDAIKKLTRESTMSKYDNTELLEKEKETPTLDTKTEEDPQLYQDAEGGHAKIDTDQGTEGNVAKNMASIAGKKKGKKNGNVKEHLEALFDGEDLSEEFQSKASTIFEAALNERIGQIEEDLVEQYQEILSENIEATTNELSEKLDDYLGYVVEQWVEENKLAIENGIRAEVAENFISGLKVLFENSYIDVPDERYNLLEEITDVKNELEEDLNKSLQDNIELRKEIVAHRCGEIFADEADGLTDVEVEKFAALSEGLEFESEDQYRDKVQVLRESYFTVSPVVLTEEQETTNQQISEDGPMDHYMSTISKHAKHDKVS